MSRPSVDEWALELALVTALRGTCLRRQVGCVLLNNRNQVLSTGYNGRARGLVHCSQPSGFEFIYGDGIDVTKQLTGQATDKRPVYGHACAGVGAASGTQLERCEAIHAEQNALLQAGDVEQIDTCYCTDEPCITCTKLLLQTSCRRVVYLRGYAGSGAALWEAAVKGEWVWSPTKYNDALQRGLDRLYPATRDGICGV